MIRSRAMLLAILVVVSTACTFAQAQNDTTVRHELYKVIEQVQKFMQGGAPATVKPYVAPEAYVISGNKMTHVLEALQAKNRSEILGEDSTRQGVEIMAQTNDREDAVYIVLKTVNAKKEDPRYHLLVLYKKPDAGWQIYMWHAGT